MATPLGFRTVQVFTDIPASTDFNVGNRQGNVLYFEVTNKTASDVDFIVNDNPEGGMPGVAIPVQAGTTRAIPMALYEFRATGVVTVVAYGM